MTKLSIILAVLFFSFIASAKKYPISDHYDGEKFFNPEGHDIKSFWTVLKWKLTSETSPWPESIPNSNYTLPPLETKKGVVTFINHASFLVQLPGVNVLTDPIYSERASPVKFAGPKRVRAPGIEFELLPPIDVVVISHNHYDHLDLETLQRLDGKYHPLFLVPLGDEKLLKNAGIQNVKELDWWDEVQVKDLKITFAPSQHWSARGLFDKCESLWGSFMLDHNGSKIYFAGDTGYGNHFSKIHERIGAPLLSLLPIGAYEPRWFMRAFHMNPEEALKAHEDLGSFLSFGMHMGTFQLTDEAYDRPVKDLHMSRQKMGISPEKFRILDQGESYTY